MKKIVLYISLCFLLCISTINSIFASGVSVSANKSKVTVGEKVTFTVSVNGAGFVNVSGAVKDRVWLDNSSKSYSVTAKDVGSLTINVSGVIADYTTENDVNVSGSKTISVVAKNTPTKPSSKPQHVYIDNRSKDNSLASLSISEGQLSTPFKPSLTKYSVNVSATTNKITLIAKANDQKAKVSGVGEKSLNVGKNVFVIKCIAENGSVRNYTIEVNVDEKPLVYIEYNNQKLGVVRNLKEVGIPNGFKECEAILNNQNITAWNNDRLGLTVSYLIDEKGKKGFYVIDNNKVIYPYKEVFIDERSFIVLPIEKKDRTGFDFKKVNINDMVLDGWTYNDEIMKNYIQLYLMNDQGQKSYYNYEMTEHQLQKYIEPKEEQFNNYMIISIVLGILLIGSIGYIIYDKKKK